MKLPGTFYQDTDVIKLSKELLGKFLFTNIDGVISGGYITETEAYNGIIDKASHAFGGRHTPRTSTMFKQGGIAYVYLCYGIHDMLNIVTSVEGDPRAILIRGFNPTEGIDVIVARRGMPVTKPAIAQGPGSVAKALGIGRLHNGISLQSDELWLEDRDMVIPDDAIAAVPRIGVAYAGQDALLPYRFYIRGNPYVSKPNKL